MVNGLFKPHATHHWRADNDNDDSSPSRVCDFRGGAVETRPWRGGFGDDVS
jgi:hypothetical protein